MLQDSSFVLLLFHGVCLFPLVDWIAVKVYEQYHISCESTIKWDEEDVETLFMADYIGVIFFFIAYKVLICTCVDDYDQCKIYGCFLWSVEVSNRKTLSIQSRTAL